MKSTILGLLAFAISATTFASEKVTATPASASATRLFECSADLRAKVELAAPGATKRVSQMWTNDRAVDPMTLRFINEKMAGKTIGGVAETCLEDAMDVVFSLDSEGESANTQVIVTLRGSLVTVR